MGGKSRKTGGISRALVERLKAAQDSKAAIQPEKPARKEKAEKDDHKLAKALKDLEG